MTAAIAASIIRKEKDLVARFRQARALTPDSAQSLASVGADEGAAFRRLRSRAILRESTAGRFFLDESSWEAFDRSRNRLLGILLLAALALLLTGLFTSWWK